MHWDSTNNHKFMAAIVLAIAASTESIPLTAQQPLVLEEVIVTARKRAESLQSVPLSISAISELEIQRLGVASTEDVAKLTPGLIFNRGIGGSDIRPDIRGITQLSGRSNVAILIDGVDQTTDALTGTGAGQLVGMGLFDLERIEVVKGPQSALFGRNAFGGAISYITKRPSDEFDVNVELDGAEYGNYRGKLGITGPLSEQFLYRLNYAHDETGGYYRHPETRDRLGDSETDAVSLTLQWLPSDGISNLIRLDYSEQDQGQNAIAVAPYNKCEQIRGKSNPTPFTDGTASIVDGGCEFRSFVGPDFSDFPNITFGEDVPVYRGDLPSEIKEEDILLSPEGVSGTGNEVTQFSNLLEWAINEEFELVSNTAFIKHDGRDDYDLDQQGTSAELQSLSLAGFSFGWVSPDNPLNFRFDTEFEREVIFQDLHLSFDRGDSIQWMIGVEYYGEEYDQVNYQRANHAIDPRGTSPIATGTVLTGTWVDVTGSIPTPEFEFSEATITGTLPRRDFRDTEVGSIYGSFDWALSEQWELSLSARYQRETVEIEFDALDSTYLVPAFEDQKAGTFYASIPTAGGSPCSVTGGVESPSGALCSVASAPLNEGPRNISGKETFSAFNPRVSLTYHLNDDVMFYGSVAEGTKPGGFNFNANLVESNQAYDLEELIAYELGWKSTWESGRTQFNGTLFFNDNTDKQANDIQYSNEGGAPETFVNNIGKVESYGTELKLATMILEGLFFDFNYVYTKTEIKNFSQAISPDGDASTDLSGEELPWTPEHSAVGTLRYQKQLNSSIGMFVRWDTRYMSERNLDLEGDVQFESKTVSDFKVGLTTEKLEVIVYVDNIFDDRTPENGVAFVNFFQAFQDMAIIYPPPKRLVGARLSYHFAP
ncbi:MAG: outer membrane receptor protein involved in Fe transport [Alcanivorax sp.]|jgi:outer membrane receptor protein involved in Fe transport